MASCSSVAALVHMNLDTDLLVTVVDMYMECADHQSEFVEFRSQLMKFTNAINIHLCYIREYINPVTTYQ